jgi:hypothetical protein
MILGAISEVRIGCHDAVRAREPGSQGAGGHGRRRGHGAAALPAAGEPGRGRVLAAHRAGAIVCVNEERTKPTVVELSLCAAVLERGAGTAE